LTHVRDITYFLNCLEFVDQTAEESGLFVVALILFVHGVTNMHFCVLALAGQEGSESGRIQPKIQ
jgi:hypothetical protein